MTITSSGAICDVCGDYILPIDEIEAVHPFKIKGIKQTLHCDNKCVALLIKIGTDWTKLPQTGNLYKIFEEHNTKSPK